MAAASSLSENVNKTMDEKGAEFIRKNMKDIISSTLWHKIKVFTKRNPIKSTALVMNTPNFITNVNNFVIATTNNNIDLIPTITANNTSHVEYIWIVEIFEGIDIGISFKYIAQNKKADVVAIHLDKKEIENKLIRAKHFSFLLSDINTLIINEHISSYHESDTASDWEEWQEWDEWQPWQNQESEQKSEEKLDSVKC